MSVLAGLWAAVGQIPYDVRSPEEVALAAQVLLMFMLVGAVGCPVALYFVMRRQRRRQEELRALLDEAEDAHEEAGD